uniref:Uncharacterized protein n=1 Tax=Cacopsylla melanoneura TaxID=428564 RepID=A0A8D9BN00_9HEMI
MSVMMPLVRIWESSCLTRSWTTRASPCSRVDSSTSPTTATSTPRSRHSSRVPHSTTCSALSTSRGDRSTHREVVNITAASPARAIRYSMLCCNWPTSSPTCSCRPVVVRPPLLPPPCLVSSVAVAQEAAASETNTPTSRWAPRSHRPTCTRSWPASSRTRRSTSKVARRTPKSF